MSLFPAYLNATTSDVKTDDEQTVDNEQPQWLKNSSFEPGASKLVSNNIEESEFHDTKVLNSYKLYKKLHGKKKKKKDKKHIKQIKQPKIHNIEGILKDCDFISIDRKKENGNLKVDKLYRPAVPTFRVSNKYFALDNDDGWVNISSKQKPIKRYYAYKEKDYGDGNIEVYIEKDCLIQNKMLLNIPKQRDEEIEHIKLNSIKCENNLTLLTSEYNKQLSEHPFDINLWIKFVNYQQTLYSLNSRHGYAFTLNKKGILEKQIAILDKALSFNNDNDKLLDMKWIIAEDYFTTEEFNKEILNELEKYSNKAVLWSHYINASQNSLSDCTTSSVLKKYSDAMFALNKKKRGLSLVDQLSIQKDIIELFIKCGLFLRQAGHYEQLLTLINMYFSISIKHFDGDLIEKLYTDSPDDIILDNELKTMPLNKAWYQVELMRTRDRWLPLPKHMADNAEDPQRIVLPEEMAELVQPLTIHKSVIANLVTASFILLKMPILPFRHFVVKQLGIHKCHYYLDSLEIILSSLFMAHNFEDSNIGDKKASNSLLVMLKTAMPPNYYGKSASSQTYCSFLTSLLRHITDCLYAMDLIDEANMFLVWWLRFERYCMVVNLCTDNSRLVSEVKLLLGKPQYRNNIPLFIEFALLKNQVGKKSDALKIFQKLIDGQSTLLDNNPIHLNVAYRAPYTAIYKNMVEILIQADCKKEALKNLIALATGVLPECASLNLTEEALLIFSNVTESILVDEEQFAYCTIQYNYLPQFLIEWVSCHAWFLYLTQNVKTSVSMLKDVIEKIQNIIKINKYQENHAAEEILTEVMIIIINYHCNQSKNYHKELKICLRSAISKYSHNMQFLFSMVWNEIKFGGFGTPLWQIENVYVDNTLAENMETVRIMLILIGRERLRIASDVAVMSLTDNGDSMSIYGGGNILDLFKNMCNLFEYFIKNLSGIKEMKKCPMFWRLYLQYISESSPSNYKKCYYEAVENCPWHKLLYMEAAFYLPEELTNICDILVEKQLRIHITQEELLILRED
ncbi:siRNA-mediated silencing protein NRDE-2,Tetratricopeptide-like helical domain [Cinara cedri]|uniref:SiRNA-mediated silencing protein NRDE-2,Tetratricopeptide-like helical domain n=1 Tax=Cinara cedri TaxID=506608 RepID=A0A5E4NLH4_9HEMI|nr:siRNA-mediated silencing protein NRDE-2,Tetratricopeptide-like helical domain [Cinara cedri]